MAGNFQKEGTMYINYIEYTALGGTLQSAAFEIAVRKAEIKLDYFTFDRLKTLTVIPDEVKELLVLFTDKIAAAPIDGNVTSYSNGIESLGYSGAQRDLLDEELSDLATEYLSIDLISTYVGGMPCMTRP